MQPLHAVIRIVWTVAARRPHDRDTSGQARELPLQHR